jgi:hypothetical protein
LTDNETYIYYGATIFSLVVTFILIFIIKDVIGSSIPSKEKDLVNSDIQESEFMSEGEKMIFQTDKDKR